MKPTPKIRSNTCGLLLACWIAAAGGCHRPNIASKDTGPPIVTVCQPVQRKVTEYAIFTGRTEAVDAVEVKARVTGYLMKTLFDEGKSVKVNDILCEIDPRTYQAQYDAAQGEVAVNEAKYQLAKTENERAKTLYKENPKAISLKALDQHQAEEDSAAAGVAAAKSSMEVYKLDLEFTKVTAPVAGRVGRYEVTIGNLVTADSTTLTTIVSQDPIYVYFDVDEKTMLDALRKLYAKKLPPLDSGRIKVGMALQDDQGFPWTGTVDFANNTVDPSTGTLTLRASFANPANSDGLRMLMPGLFVRVRLPLSLPESALLVSEQAVGTDQGQKYVYVVDENDEVQYRRVVLGQLEDDGLRVIKKGISAGERVVVDRLQTIRPKMQVSAEETPMPTIKGADGRQETAGTTSVEQ